MLRDLAELPYERVSRILGIKAGSERRCVYPGFGSVESGCLFVDGQYPAAWKLCGKTFAVDFSFA